MLVGGPRLAAGPRIAASRKFPAGAPVRMSRRTRRTLLIVAALLVLVALAVFLRSKAPPEAARLLPESDGIIYIDLRPIRAVLHKELKPPQHSRRVPGVH